MRTRALLAPLSIIPLVITLTGCFGGYKEVDRDGEPALMWDLPDEIADRRDIVQGTYYPTVKDSELYCNLNDYDQDCKSRDELKEALLENMIENYQYN